MRVTVVGCAGSFPGPDSPASCYLVEHDGFAVALDLGNGSLGPLQRFIDIDVLDAVVLSHLHVDHCIDLCSYYVARRYRPGGALGTIPVLGPTGTANRMANAYDLPLEPGMHGEFDFVDHSPAPVQLGPFTVSVTRVAHPVEAYAVRLEADGRSVVYSGDTGPSDALVELAAGRTSRCSRRRSSTTRPTPPGCTCRPPRPPGTPTAPTSAGWSSPTWWRGTRGDRTEAEARAVYDGDMTLAETGQVFVL